MGWAISHLVIAAAVRQHLAARALEKTFLLATEAAAVRQFLADHLCYNGWRAMKKSSAFVSKQTGQPEKQRSGDS